ncbi:hypothetical protein [Ferribacterium limneticum]|uniref:hypothetical protein n=1 Tax=Ferribacterium limneticum TaxID=76259 RepID=UPI001CFBF7A5|nr:hypothetical protein [Ferribacterium limneticum]UCV17859.1 hypothetical protein KI610_13670 [Ferribacterium limneticum]
MSTFKDVLCLLAIFVLYGIAGRLDYEDAVGLQQTHQDQLRAACLRDLPESHDAQAQIDDQRLDPPDKSMNAELSADAPPCTSAVL